MRRRERLYAEGAPAAAEFDMLALCASFPSTRDLFETWDPATADALGVAIWRNLSQQDPPMWDEDFDEAPLPESLKTLTTLRFLLRVHDVDRTWACGRFEAVAALLDIWDAPHRAAFAAWVAALDDI